ncbi:unnamed protein product [Pleuronectes platessa]|uniref:Uncharacterized protein n=1 Tax=Pleuronectes platessa TaxID=8262 RepID=A0A9N7Z8V3_PLEPL|nr:unnamed protein product [Pleuronectes platessa]
MSVRTPPHEPTSVTLPPNLARSIPPSPGGGTPAKSGSVSPGEPSTVPSTLAVKAKSDCSTGRWIKPQPIRSERRATQQLTKLGQTSRSRKSQATDDGGLKTRWRAAVLTPQVAGAAS